MSSVFELDQAGKRKTAQQAQLNAYDATQPLPPSGFQGSGEAAKSLLEAPAEAGRTILTAAGAAPVTWDAVHGWISGKPQYGAQDWWFKNTVDTLGNEAVDFWRPDASQMGTSAQVLSGVGQIVGSIPQMIGTPEVFLANSAFSPATEMVRQGVDAKTALEAGGLSLAVNAAGFKLPAVVGNTAATRIASGVGINVALGAGNDAATAAVLRSGGYSNMAKNYDWANMRARGMDVLMGAVFGGIGHAGEVVKGRSMEAMQKQVDAMRGQAKDALMTQLSGDHFAASSLPGEPASLAAVGRGKKALSTAIAQILEGDRVDVADMIHADDFVRQPEPSSFISFRRALESGGNPEARNPNSSATGIDQFTKDTWLATVKQAAPAWADGLTQKQLLEARTDPERSGDMADYLTNQNADALRAAGVPVINESLYAAWHFGIGKAIEFAKAKHDTPIADILTNAQIKANPYLKGKTKAQVLANWDERARSNGVFPADELDAAHFGLPRPPQTIADTDTFFDSIPGRETVNIKAPEREKLRQNLIDEHFENIPKPDRPKGEKPVAYVMGGGGASGKGTVLHMLQEAGDIPKGGLVHIDPDAIKTGGGAHNLAGIPEYAAMLKRGDARAAAVVHEESSSIAKKVLARAIKGKYDIILDRTLGNPVKGVKELRALKDAGYDIQLTGITIDPRLAVSRAVKRAAKSLRYVPLDALLTAHRGFARGFETYAEMADQARLIDNSIIRGETPRDVAIKTGEALEILNPELYNSFRGRENINAEATTLRDILAETTPDAAVERSDRVAATGRNEASDRSTRTRGNRAIPADRAPEQGESGQLTPIEDAAVAAVTNNPDLQITLDDGTTVSASEALAQADQDIQQAQIDAKGIEAAATCAMRFPDAS